MARDELPTAVEVVQADSRTRFGVELRQEGIRHDQLAVFDADRNTQRAAFGYGVVLDGIRQQLLQRQHGQSVIQVFRGDIDIEKELVGIAYLEQVSVGFGETQLLRERRQHVPSVRRPRARASPAN